MAILAQVLQEGNSDYTVAASLDSLSSALFVTTDDTIK
jgi:hypothetical protein